MFTWVVPAVIIVLFALISVWGIVFGGFVPYRSTEGRVAAIDDSPALGQAADGDIRRAKKPPTRFVLVVYRLDGRTYQAFSVLPDFALGLKRGDRVRLVVGRNRRQCWITGRAEL